MSEEITGNRAYRLRLGPWVVFSWEVEAEPVIVQLANSDEDTGEEISGGASHNFERDVTPGDPNERYAPWEERKFGFR